MGYQCEIVLCLSPDGQEAFNKHARETAEKLQAEEFKAFTEFLANPTERLDAEGATLRFWSWRTWHKDVPEWRIMRNIMDLLEPGQILFYSVGQDLDDIERQGLITTILSICIWSERSLLPHKRRVHQHRLIRHNF